MKRANVILSCLMMAIYVLAQSETRALSGSYAPGERSGQASPLVFLPVIRRASAGPVIHSFTANPAVIQPGNSTTLSWQVTGATSLSIAPGIGAVTGTSIPVSPANTTAYTLTATNASGSASAQATVTVAGVPPPSDGFFIVPAPDIELPTSHPTVKVDPAGGVHVVFTPESATQNNPTRPAYYAYCPANCTSAAAFTIVALGNGVDYAALELNPAGDPRVLLRLPATNQSKSIFIYQYWVCDSNCLNPAQWLGDSIGFSYGRQVGWVEPFIHSFALDHLGRPRFMYYDNGADYNDPHWGAFYAYCDGGCTSAANWYETRLLDDFDAYDFKLAFSPNGQPRLVYGTYDSDTVSQQMAYAECNQNCGAAANWSGSVLVNTVSAGVSHFATFSLAVNSAGKPRVALYTGTGSGGNLAPNTLYYLACQGANCSQTGSWTALDLNFMETRGEEGVALTLDAQGRPRMAYHAPMAAGFGLHYAWCNTNCESSNQNWQTQEREASEEVNAELPIPPWPGCQFPACNPPIPPCTVSTWDSGVRPSLALDAAGQPRIAYDANHEQGGACGTFTDTKQTRFIGFSQP
jgi:hypothetical protein